MSDETSVELAPKNGSMLIEDGDRDLYAAAAEHFPVEAHKTELRSGTEITYLGGEDIISRMNKVFVYGWESEVMEHGINEDADEAWVRMRVTIWRKATLMTTVVDKLPGGEKITTSQAEQLIPIRREQFGSQKLKRARSTGKILNLGFDIEGAATKALKKTVSLLGVGLYLWNKEERELIKAMQAEMEQEQRQQRQGSGQTEGGQDAPQGGTGRLRRPNLPRSQGSGGSTPDGAPAVSTEAPANGALIINGKTMPDGFEQPFALMEQGKSQTQCRTEQCGTVIDPNGDYKVGDEMKKGGYVIKRSREMAGTILCATHAALWNRALQKARTATANTAA